ncbi:hypothetical protein EI94DRAFT_1706568 [Lactarius quietus]|nr:hypothetical protein EI94DRAFT_1706568 [Lactarius quietus]
MEDLQQEGVDLIAEALVTVASEVPGADTTRNHIPSRNREQMASSFQPILDAALADYDKQVGIDLAAYPFSGSLRSCASPDDVLKLLEDKAHKFKGVLGASITSVPFEPTIAIFSGVDVLITAGSSFSSSYDALVDLFECLGNYLTYLRIYSDLTLTPSMTEISVKITVGLLSVFTLATKQIQPGGFQKFAKKLLGESEIEAILHRLHRPTQEESRMTMAQTF